MAQDLRTESKMKMETNEILKSFYIYFLKPPLSFQLNVHSISLINLQETYTFQLFISQQVKCFIIL